MLTLGIDTSGDVCAVALLDDGPAGAVVRFRAEIAVPRAHGRRLAPLVAQAFEHVGEPVSALGLVAVAAGPGSYTGLRIGMSTAKGLALATGCAFAAVPTLQALAATARLPNSIHPSDKRHQPAVVVAVLPSRRGEVYAGAYRPGAVPEETAAPAALALDEIADWMPPGAALGGPGVGALDGLDIDAPRVEMRATGEAVARLGLARWRATGGDDPAAAEPLYLKPVAATRPRGIFGA